MMPSSTHWAQDGATTTTIKEEKKRSNDTNDARHAKAANRANRVDDNLDFRVEVEEIAFTPINLTRYCQVPISFTISSQYRVDVIQQGLGGIRLGIANFACSWFNF